MGHLWSGCSLPMKLTGLFSVSWAVLFVLSCLGRVTPEPMLRSSRSHPLPTFLLAPLIMSLCLWPQASEVIAGIPGLYSCKKFPQAGHKHSKGNSEVVPNSFPMRLLPSCPHPDSTGSAHLLVLLCWKRWAGEAGQGVMCHADGPGLPH